VFVVLALPAVVSGPLKYLEFHGDVLMTVIDVHTHMLTREYLELLTAEGGPKYEVKPTKAGQESVHLHGVPFMTLTEPMWDYELRIKDMDKAGVDVAIVSLTCPSAYFGDETISLKVATMVNNSMQEQNRIRPDRIQWFATLPWQYETVALEELKRATLNGAIGVFVSANIDGRNLTDPMFAAVWQAIDDLALPVLVHPTAPQGMESMYMNEYGLVPPIGFTFDTTLAISRMILDGFIDRYPNLKIIAGHGGGTLPYLVGRLDRCHEMIPACSDVIKDKPSEYLRRIYYDGVVYSQDALELCIKVGGEDNVLYGSDYPHNIGDMAGTLTRANALSQGVSRKVKSGNALRVFNL
jgi:aminocarboxymuconate-semialdehyde decarboxylase